MGVWGRDTSNQEYDTQQNCPSEMKAKGIPRQTKAKGVHHHQTTLTRNAKGSSTWKHKKIKLSGKGKYVVKFRIPYYCNGGIWVILSLYKS